MMGTNTLEYGGADPLMAILCAGVVWGLIWLFTDK